MRLLACLRVRAATRLHTLTRRIHITARCRYLLKDSQAGRANGIFIIGTTDDLLRLRREVEGMAGAEFRAARKAGKWPTEDPDRLMQKPKL